MDDGKLINDFKSIICHISVHNPMIEVRQKTIFDTRVFGYSLYWAKLGFLKLISERQKITQRRGDEYSKFDKFLRFFNE